LTTNKEDVECKTCKGAKQWVLIEAGGPAAKGCYDCKDAIPQCKVLEYDSPSSTCRCKTDECIGDQTQDSPKRHTVIQDTTGVQACKACSEHVANGLWCSGTHASPVVETCQ